MLCLSAIYVYPNFRRTDVSEKFPMKINCFQFLCRMITDAFEECDLSCFQDLSFQYLQEEERFWERGSNVVGNLTQSTLANAYTSFEKAWNTNPLFS